MKTENINLQEQNQGITKEVKKKEFWRAVKFTLISISAGLVQTASYAILYSWIGLNHWVASAIALVLSVIWNFPINRKITFKSVGNLNRAMLLVALFYVVFGPAVIYLNYLGENMANGYLLLAGTMIVNLVLEYIYTRLVVYRFSCDNAKTAKNECENINNDVKVQENTENNTDINDIEKE